MSLAQLASRLSILKANTPEKAGLITFTIGALYSAFEAQKCGFTDRITHSERWRIELNDALLAAGDIAAARRSSKTSWVGIVHFNSALMRIDVAFERLIRYVTRNTSGRIDVLIRLARKKGIPSKPLRSWEKIRGQEVNVLKHRSPSALIRKRMKYAEMLKALEDLVGLLERQL